MNPIDLLEPGEEPPERGVCHTLLFGLTFTLIFLAVSGLSAAAGSGTPSVELASLAQSGLDSEKGRLAQPLTARIDRGIERGLMYLRRKQFGNGALSGRFSVAVTALGGLAFLGYGAEYKRGRHGVVIMRAAEYLINRQRADGYISDEDTEFPSRMHGHAYAVLFLSQVVGTIPPPHEEQRRKVRRAIEKGTQLIEREQTTRGGWWYDPGDREKDEASLTVCCLQALRAAKDAGFEVNVRTIRRAVTYLKECCREDGSFRYSLARQIHRSSYELTAAAVSTLNAAGEYAIEEHKRGVSFMLLQLKNRRNPLSVCANFYFYGNFYAAQVLYQLGGETWDGWAKRAYPRLLDDQEKNEDGSWESTRYGDRYATAMALLILELPLGYLPIFER